MNIEDKVVESSDLSKLVLYKEGAFYKLYNQHAMFFAHHVKPFKVGVKFIKKISDTIYSIGFPISSFDKLIDGKFIKQLLEKLSTSMVLNDDKIVCSGLDKLYISQLPDYEIWCAEQNQQTDNLNDNVERNMDNEMTIKQKIMNFNVGCKTPIQAMSFISELQQEIAS